MSRLQTSFATLILLSVAGCGGEPPKTSAPAGPIRWGMFVKTDSFRLRQYPLDDIQIDGRPAETATVVVDVAAPVELFKLDAWKGDHRTDFALRGPNTHHLPEPYRTHAGSALESHWGDEPLPFRVRVTFIAVRADVEAEQLVMYFRGNEVARLTAENRRQGEVKINTPFGPGPKK